MYRSFVTCDDPKGVVECGTIRKSKIASHKMEGKKKKSHRTDKGKKDEMEASPCSFQLLEVSRGAQKLNHLIDSWLSYDGQSKDIAKELLKGALDLQESLTMLGKFQEASHYVSQLKKKQKDKVERGRIDQVCCERTYSDRRLSADGPSRDCIEELRVAIRDGLARQNLSSQEKTRSHRRKMESGFDIPSSSSTHSTHYIPSSSSTHSTHSTDSSMSEIKGKAPNLIAKLMGLDYIPSKPLMQPPQKQLDMEMISSPKRPTFEIEMPKLRKPQPVLQKVDLEQRTLREVLETVQFQGLLKGTSAVEHKSSNFHSKQKLIDDVHPIVLIKPIRAPSFDSEEAFVVREEGRLNTKMRMKEVTSNASKMHFRAERVEIPIERVIREGAAKDHMKLSVMPEEKEVRTIEHSERAANARRKLEPENASVRRLNHEEGAKDRKEVTARAEEKETKKKWKDSSLKMKSSNLADHKQRKEDTTDKKVDKVQKLVTSSKSPIERETLKAKSASRFEDQAKLTSTKLRKPENGSNTTNEHASQQRNTDRKNNSKHTAQTAIHSSTRKQKEKQATELTISRPVIEDLDCREEEKRIDLTCEKDCVKKESSIKEEELNAYKFQPEDFGQRQTSLCTDTKGISSSEKTDDKMTEITVDSAISKSENQLKDLLLSSLQFQNLAEDHFHLNSSYPNISPASEIFDQGVTDTKLSLDYAKEYIQRRSFSDSRTRHPLLSYMEISRIRLSLDQLAEEVCNGVETLRSYHKLARDELGADSLYATMERDMMCKGVVSGIWNLGWRNGFSVDEVEQAVNDLEKLLVSELIGEIFS